MHACMHAGGNSALLVKSCYSRAEKDSQSKYVARERGERGLGTGEEGREERRGEMEEGRGERGEGRGKREEGPGKREEGRGKREEGRGMKFITMGENECS